MSAFVPTFTRVGTSASALHGSAVCTKRPTVVGVRATLSDDKRAFSSRLSGDNEDARIRRESEYRGPQGWTPYAEKVNGRLAQLGFVIGLVTEIATGKPISEQILIMFSPLVGAAHALTVLSANAAHLN